MVDLYVNFFSPNFRIDKGKIVILSPKAFRGLEMKSFRKSLSGSSLSSSGSESELIVLQTVDGVHCLQWV